MECLLSDNLVRCFPHRVTLNSHSSCLRFPPACLPESTPAPSLGSPAACAPPLFFSASQDPAAPLICFHISPYKQVQAIPKLKEIHLSPCAQQMYRAAIPARGHLVTAPPHHLLTDLMPLEKNWLSSQQTPSTPSSKVLFSSPAESTPLDTVPLLTEAPHSHSARL